MFTIHVVVVDFAIYNVCVRRACVLCMLAYMCNEVTNVHVVKWCMFD